uniref:F-box domain-containing protein n=1 Tax=Steinernema glaseri TaxID=37863 RepID=A0A1I8A1L7_9BILA
MDTVPQIFVQSVCLCLQDHPSLQESCKISSFWGEICTATRKKIRTLNVIVDESEGKLYAAVSPPSPKHDSFVALDSVDLKFITNFAIESLFYFAGNLPNGFKEITLGEFKRLVRFVSPMERGRHPAKYNFESSNSLSICVPTCRITKQLLTMRLPVSSISLLCREHEPAVVDFYENAGPLYFIYDLATHQPSKIDKFVPVDSGRFFHFEPLPIDQLETLVLKCEMSDKKVMIKVQLEDCTEKSEVTDFFDFDKYYLEKKVGKREVIARRKGAKLSVRVSRFTIKGQLQWQWFDSDNGST